MIRNIPVCIAATLLIAAAGFSAPAFAKDKAPALPASVKAFDPDKDGTLDLPEVKAAASALFDKLEKDKDATLDAKELKGRLTTDELKTADPDKDGTLTKAEFLAVVEARFLAANPDKDGTIDAKELKSPAGKALLRLMK